MDVIQTFDTVTGRRQGTLPASAWKWKRAVSGPGSLSVTIPYTQAVMGRDLRTELSPWRTTIAVVDSETRRVLAAGMVYQRRWDADTATLDVTCADMWDMLKLRLVIEPSLDTHRTGTITGDNGLYPSPWSRRLTGSLSDIASALVNISMSAGRLPIVLPPNTGGQNERTYQGPDFATVASRLSELTQVIDGPEIVFQPRLAETSTSLQWHMLTGTPELVVATHSWDLRRRATPLVSITIDEDASDMIGDSWARGGSQDDKTVIAHHHDTWLEKAGWPLLQGADTSHTSLSNAATLLEYARSATQMRAESTEVVQLKARRLDAIGEPLGDAVTPGDHLTLRHDDPYLGSGAIDLKVLEVSGDESEWVTLSCREVIEE